MMLIHYALWFQASPRTNCKVHGICLHLLLSPLQEWVFLPSAQPSTHRAFLLYHLSAESLSTSTCGVSNNKPMSIKDNKISLTDTSPHI